MKAVIHKFALPHHGQISLQLPRDSKFLHVAVQRGLPVVWAQISESPNHENRVLEVVMTGEEFKVTNQTAYLGTFLAESGNYVAHVYERLS